MGNPGNVTYRAVFLDRDGVINRPIIRDGKPHAPASLAQFELLPGIAESLTSLKARGYLTLIVTNQPDVSRGTLQRESIDIIHEQLKKDLPLDGIFVCFHDDADRCDCRKPQPGLLFRAALELDIDLKCSFMVGDRWRDMEAGKRAGCRTFFIDWRYRDEPPSACDHRVNSLAEASAIILKRPAQP
jgi:D-glycero-D-manno-heptose 1,7-bisphosphate phosphatase